MSDEQNISVREPIKLPLITNEQLQQAQSSLPASTCSALTIESLLLRLATRGLLPCEHTLSIWQHADNSGWGADVETPFGEFNVEAHGVTLRAALEGLMHATNRGADVKPND